MCVFLDTSRCDIYLASYSRDAHEMHVGLHGNCPLPFSGLAKSVIYRPILVTLSTIIY